MKHIGLIGCSKSKLRQNDAPDKLFRAEDIYQGKTFLKSKNEGLARFGCEDFYILSAKHELLDKDKEICYYDVKLAEATAPKTADSCETVDKKIWAGKILEQLKMKFDLAEVKFYIFAVKDYYEYLTPYLNCVVFNFEDPECIDFDNFTEYKNGRRSGNNGIDTNVAGHI